MIDLSVLFTDIIKSRLKLHSSVLHCFFDIDRLPAALRLFKILLIFFLFEMLTNSAVLALKSLYWVTVIWTKWVFCVHQMGKITHWITLSPWEPKDDSLSDPLSVETVHILLSLARHASIYQQNHSVLLKWFEVWPTFHVLHFQNLLCGFFSLVKACFPISPKLIPFLFFLRLCNNIEVCLSVNIALLGLRVWYMPVGYNTSWGQFYEAHTVLYSYLLCTYKGVIKDSSQQRKS